MKAAVATAALILCACREDRPPAPTPQESAQLNEMESALNDMAENQEGPADRSTGPSNASN